MHGAMPHAKFHALRGIGHGLFYYPEARELTRQIVDKQAALWHKPVNAAIGD
jgi:hypothetical protein